MNKIIRFSLFSLLLLSLAGCSGQLIKPASVESSSYLSDNLEKEHFLTKNIEVKANNFFFNKKSTDGSRNRSNLNNQSFKKALENSLSSIGFLHDGVSDYTLEASLVESSLVEKFVKRFESNREIDIVINYVLIDKESNIIYEKDISGVGVIKKGRFSVNVYDIEKVAIEEAYRNNIKRLVEDLTTLESPAKENGD